MKFHFSAVWEINMHARFYICSIFGEEEIFLRIRLFWLYVIRKKKINIIARW